MTRIQLGLSFACIGFLFTGAGCSSGPSLPSDLPDLKPCVIAVTQDGAPLDGATVMLKSATESQWFPGGQTDASGKVEIYTNGRYKGAPQGKYKIVVTKTEVDPSKLGPAPPDDSPGYGDWLEKSAAEVRHSYSLIEKQYTNVETTTLEIDVAGGKTEKTVDVGKKVRDKI